jgi:hypothetical protein
MGRDLRKYHRQTNYQLIAGALILLFIVGGGLVYLIWGYSTAISTLLCMGAALIPAGLIISIFWIMDWIVKRARKNE